MRQLIEYGKNKLDDPILMSWALRRYQHAQLRGSDLCRCMEEAWFHDLALRRWIDSSDHTLLEELFRVLPSRLFANVRPGLVDRWITWSGGLGAKATTVLVECPLEEVLPLLAQHIDRNLLDFQKTAAVISAIADLPSPNALPLLDDVTKRVLQLQNESFTKRMLMYALLRPTATLSHGTLVRLIETCVQVMRGDKAEGDRLLRRVFSALFGNDALLEKAKDLMDGRYAQPFRSLQPLFNSGAPLDECDRILGESDPWLDAKHFLNKHGAAAGATETALAVIALMQSLDASEHANMACFAIATVLRAFELDEIGAGGLSMEEALDVLALDLSDNRHSLQLTQRLGAFNPQDIARAVSERMPVVKNGWGAVHLATMAGELRLADTIRILIDSLGSERGDFLSEAAQKSLVQIGEPAELALIAHWDELDSSQKIYGQGALEQIGGEPTSRFAIERFQELFSDDHEGWCALAEAAPHEQAINLLAPELRRKQPVIDKCFYRLCILTGRKTDNLKDIRERVREHRQRVLEHQSDCAAGNFRRPRDTITLTLKCERCGDVNRYEVKSVVTGTSKTGSPYFVGDDLRCASCGEAADFEFTAEAHMQVMAALITFAADRGGAKRKGPVQLMNVSYRWQTRPAPEVMAELKAAVAEYPQNIVNHLRLARFQYVFGRRKRAAECYSQALEIERDSLEAGLGIAHVMVDTGERRNAFNRLAEMLQRKSKWRFFRVDELSPQTLTEDFVRLFNKLHSELGVSDRPLLHTSFGQSSAKVGRNDMCPCGSGKKYKRCCGDTQAAMVH
jgi:tetratricopeptide (TPR) repeat protein